MALIRRTPLPLLRAGARIWRAACTLGRLTAKPRSLILMYHDVGDGIPLDLFKRQMEYLRDHARVVSLEALLESGPGAQGVTCAITFDDGYEGVYRHAFALLREFGLPATIYLSTAFIRDTDRAVVHAPSHGLIAGRRLLSWRQVREMDRAGIRFGSHLSEHGDLSVLSADDAIAQLCRSKDEIAARLGKPCVHFAYPFGRFNLNSVNLVRGAGYQTAVTTVHRPLIPDEDPLRLPRIGIEDRYSWRDFLGVLRGDWDYIGALQSLRRPALRMGRKPPGGRALTSAEQES